MNLNEAKPKSYNEPLYDSGEAPLDLEGAVDPEDFDAEITALERYEGTVALEQNLYSFIQHAWPVLEPHAPFTEAWHIEAICDHLMAVSRGEIKRLVINIPPRHLKSLTVSVFWPAWVWATKPGLKWLCTSYGYNLVIRDSVKTRRLIQSAWYQQNWGHRYRLSGDQNAKARFDNDQGGYRIVNSLDSGVTGEGGDIIVVDDPSQLGDATNPGALQSVADVWDGVLATRLNDPVTGAMVIIMQRLHENDLTGHVLREGGWTHLYLPTEYESKRKCVTFLPRDLDGEGRPQPHAQPFFWDPRTEEGELLCPNRFPPHSVASLKMKGDFFFAAQQQQRPVPAGGGLFKESWWQFYHTLPADLDVYGDACQSWDCSFKDLATSSYVVGTVWARKGSLIYLLYRLRKRMNLPETLAAIRSVSNMFPWVGPKLIEDKANGTAAISMLQSEISGIIPITPEGGKESRAQAVTYLVEAGNVLLPDPANQPWVKELISEFTSFPRGEYSDQVDSATQAWYWFHQRRPMGVPLGELFGAGSGIPMVEHRRVF